MTTQLSKSKSSEKKVHALRDSVVMKMIKKHIEKFMAQVHQSLIRWHVNAHKHSLEVDALRRFTARYRAASRDVAVRVLSVAVNSRRSTEVRGLVGAWSRHTLRRYYSTATPGQEWSKETTGNAQY